MFVLPHGIRYRAERSCRSTIYRGRGCSGKRAHVRIDTHLLGRLARRQHVDPGTHHAAGQGALDRRTARTFHERLVLGEVLPHLLLHGLRQLLKQAFSSGTTSQALAEAGCFSSSSLDAASDGAFHVSQAETLSNRSTSTPKQSSANTRAQRCSGRTLWLNLFVNLVHGRASYYSTLAQGASCCCLARSLSGGSRCTNHASSTSSHKSATANQATGQHLRCRFSDSASDHRGIGDVGASDISGSAILPGIIDFGFGRLAFGAVLLARFISPLAGLEACELARLVSSIIGETTIGQRTSSHVYQAGGHAGELLHATLQVGTEVAQG